MEKTNTRIILASSSKYRADILSRIGVKFEQFSPNIDEYAADSESADQLVKRLAEEKALSARDVYQNSLVIGSDQVVSGLTGILGKPDNLTEAVEQIMVHSGQEVTLSTGVALLNTKSSRLQSNVDHYRIKYKTLDRKTVERYVKREQPLDCCGALRAEGPGINLLQWMRGNDPNTLIGLPVIYLCAMLENEGYSLY